MVCVLNTGIRDVRKKKKKEKQVVILLEGKTRQIALDPEMIFELIWDNTEMITNIRYSNYESEILEDWVDLPIRKVVEAVNTRMSVFKEDNNVTTTEG